MSEVAAAARPKILTHLGAVLVGVAVFVAVCRGLAAILPFPDVPAIAPKYEYFAKNRDRFDIIFLGSSRFYHQIIPAEFDAAVEKLTGHRPRSFNAAYDAVWPPESYFYLRQLLALRPPHLRYVVIDAMDINPKLEERYRTTRRGAYWHDWQHTRMALDSIYDPLAIHEMPAEKRAEAAEGHLDFFIRGWVNLGRGAELLGARLEPPRTKPKRVPEWDGAEGYHAGGESGLTGEARESYMVTVHRLEQGLEPTEPSPSLAKAMRGIIADVRKAGAEPIFAIAPTLNEKENWGAVPEGVPLIPLNDPSKYPRLFEPDLHYDGWHLNERGAHDFTQLLAEQFVAKTRGAKAK